MFSNKLRKMARCFVPATLCLMMILTLLVCIPGTSEATGSGGGSSKNLPWEDPLKNLAFSLTGPVAQALSLIMVIIGVGILFFGGDLQGWARWVAFAVIAVGTIGGAMPLITALGVTGAVII